MVGRVKELAEEAKVAVRNIRRDGNKQADTGEKDKEFSEDDRDSVKEEIQELTKTYEGPGDRAGQGERKRSHGGMTRRTAGLFLGGRPHPDPLPEGEGTVSYWFFPSAFA